MGLVRPLRASDLPQITNLRRRLNGGNPGQVGPGEHAGGLRRYLEQIFLGSPWRDEELPSLVCEDGRGRVIGCLGVMPRPMALDGRPLRVAVSHNFMVEPARRSTLAALQLLRSFLAGPQDLSLADGTTQSRRIWEAFGGATALLYSLRWIRLLRPGRCLVYAMKTRGAPGALAAAAGPLAAAADTVAVKILPDLLPKASPAKISSEDLSWQAFLQHVRSLAAGRRLQPRYDAASSEWLFTVLAEHQGRAVLRKQLLRDDEGNVLGWYLYYLRPSGIAEVAQIAAEASSMGLVLDHLCHDAWREGAIAAVGQADPGFIDLFSGRRWVCNNGGFWTLVGSRDPAITDAIHRGEAFLTPLEHESWMRLAYRDAGGIR